MRAVGSLRAPTLLATTVLAAMPAAAWGGAGVSDDGVGTIFFLGVAMALLSLVATIGSRLRFTRGGGTLTSGATTT